MQRSLSALTIAAAITGWGWTADATETANVEDPVEASATDVSLDHAFALPTAMIQPAGSLTYNNEGILENGLTYAFRHVQLSLQGFVPLLELDGGLQLAILSAKVHFAPHPRFHLALQGLGSLLHGSLGGGDGTTFDVGAGAYATFCLTASCSSLLSAGAVYVSSAGDLPNGSHLADAGGSAIVALASHVKLLAEVDASTALELFGGGDVFLVGGVRFCGPYAGIDLGIVRDLSRGGDPLDGLPFVAFSLRPF
jgi:hypothetical protein